MKIKLVILSHHTTDVKRDRNTVDIQLMFPAVMPPVTESKRERERGSEQTRVCIFVDINFDTSDEVIRLNFLTCCDSVDIYTHIEFDTESNFHCLLFHLPLTHLFGGQIIWKRARRLW